MKNPPALLAVVLSLLFLVTLWPAKDQARGSTLAQKNLIVNPGNEFIDDAGSPVGWTAVEGQQWRQRNAGPDPREGAAYFVPSPSSYAELQQEIDLSSWTAKIRQGEVGFQFEGYISGWKTGKDTGRIIVEFFGSEGDQPLKTFDSNPIAGRLEWHNVQFLMMPPRRSKSVRISLVSHRRDGNNNDGYFDALSLVAISPGTITRPTPADNTIKHAAFFSSLPSPSGRLPSRWAYSSTILDQILEIQKPISKPLFARRTEIIPRSLSFPHSLGEGKSPPLGRGHGGASYANWDFGIAKLSDLSVDISFHKEPRPKAKVYIQLYDYKIGDTSQYFGFQYKFGKDNELKTGFIWSRWGTRDTSNAWVPRRGWIESAGYENDFIGIRYPYRWGLGTYTVHLQMRESDSQGTWYEMRIFDHQDKEWFLIGRMRFPFADGKVPFIRNGGGSWNEVYGGTESSADIGEFHLSYGGIYTAGRRVTAKSIKINYGQRIPNCDVSVDPNGRRVHVRLGGQTIRRTTPGRYSLL